MCDPHFKGHHSADERTSSPPVTGQAIVLVFSSFRRELYVHQRVSVSSSDCASFVRRTAEMYTCEAFPRWWLLTDRNLSQRLQLEVLGEEELRVGPFGDKSAINCTKAHKVELWLRRQYDGK